MWVLDVPGIVGGRVIVPREVKVKLVTFNFGVNSRRLSTSKSPTAICAPLGSLYFAVTFFQTQ